MIMEIGRFLLISGLIYLGITAVLIITNRPTTKIIDGSLDFAALTAVRYENLPELQQFTARDGAQLPYRLYESTAVNPSHHRPHHAQQYWHSLVQWADCYSI